MAVKDSVTGWLNEWRHGDDGALERVTDLHVASIRDLTLRSCHCVFSGASKGSKVAQAMQVSLTTVEGDWRFARAWLQNQLSGGRSDET